MKIPWLEERVTAVDRRLESDGVIEIDLATADQLVSEPPIEPLGRRGPYQSGASYLASVLGSVRRLPDQVTVRVVMNGESIDAGANAKAQNGLPRLLPLSR